MCEFAIASNTMVSSLGLLKATAGASRRQSVASNACLKIEHPNLFFLFYTGMPPKASNPRTEAACARELKNNVSSNVMRFVTLDAWKEPVVLAQLVGVTENGREQAIRCRTQVELDRLRALVSSLCPEAEYSTTSIGGCNFQTVTTPVGIIRYVCV